MTKSELIEKYAQQIDVSNHQGEIRDILTRLLEAYDAQRGVEGWQKEAAKAVMEFALRQSRVFYNHPDGNENVIAALIASHAPKGVDVDRVWDEMRRINQGNLDRIADTLRVDREDFQGDFVTVNKQELAAALAAQGERGKKQ